MRTRTPAAALLATAALLAGCSSGGDDAAPAPTTTPATSAATTAAAGDEAALTAAVRAYSAAFFKPDPGAGYALLSKGCRADTSRAEYTAELTAAVAAYGHQQVRNIHVDQISGGLARVTYTYDVPALDQSRQPWALEGGAWKYDGC